MTLKLMLCKQCYDTKGDVCIRMSGNPYWYWDKCISCSRKFEENEKGYVVIEVG